MASLKDINATIEEGNEDLEKLNRNFSKWFESQKKGGDDLEAAAEARTKKGKGGGVIKAAATGAAVSKMSEKDGISKYLKYALPLMLPLAWPFFKDFMNKKRFDINGDGEPDMSLTDGAVAAGLGYGAYKTVSMTNRISKSMAAARELKLQKLSIQAFNARAAAIEAQMKSDKALRKIELKRITDILKSQRGAPRGLNFSSLIGANTNGTPGTGKPTIPNRTFQFQRTIMGDGGRNMRGTNSGGVKLPSAANTNAPINTKARSASGFKKFLNRTSSLSQGSFNSIKEGMGKVTNAGSRAIKGVMPSLQNFGNNWKAYIRALATWAKTMNPGATAKKVGSLVLKILGGAFKFVGPAILPAALALSIGSWAQVMYGQKEDGTPYTQNEKIGATGRFIGGWTGYFIGASIGMAIANVPGAIIGGVFGAMSGAELASALFVWGAGKTRTLQKSVDNKKEVLMSEGLFQSDPAFANIGGLDTQGRNMFQAFAAQGKYSNKNVLARDDFGGDPFIPNTAGSLIPKLQNFADQIPGYTAMAASKSKARQFVSNGLDYRDVFLGGADIMTNQNKDDASRPPDFVRGISGGGFSTAPNANSIQMLGTAVMQARRDAAAREALMNGPEAGRGNVSSFVDAKSTNVTTVVAGGNGIKTIDTEMARRMHSYQMIGGIVSGQRAY